MALDPSIILQAGRGVTPIADPMEQAAKAQNLMGSMLQLQQQRQAMTDQAEFRKQYGMSPGMAKSVHELATAKHQEQKAEREAQKAKLEAVDAFNQKQLAVYNSIKDEASYRAALPVLAVNAQQFGIDTSQSDHPPVYDPQFVETKKAQMMSFDQQLKAQKARFDMDKPQTDLGQLEADFKAGRISPADYAEYKKKIKTHGALVNIGYSQPFEVTDPQTNQKVLVQQDKKGNLRKVEGFAPKDTEKPLTEAQGNALGFGVRARDADKIMSELEASGVDVATLLNKTVGSVPVVGNYAKSPEVQQIEQAQRNFVTAVLRKESGAAISAGEFETEAKKYFPQPGDSEKTRQQKADARKRAIEVLQIQSGRELPEVVKPVKEAAPTRAAKPEDAKLPYKGKTLPKAVFESLSVEDRRKFISGGGRAI